MLCTNSLFCAWKQQLSLGKLVLLNDGYQTVYSITITKTFKFYKTKWIFNLVVKNLVNHPHRRHGYCKQLDIHSINLGCKEYQQ